jgi:hypothetical protein
MAENEMSAKRLRTGTFGFGLLATTVNAGIPVSAAAAAPAVRVSSPVLASPAAAPARRAAARRASAHWADSDWA